MSRLVLNEARGAAATSTATVTTKVSPVCSFLKVTGTLDRPAGSGCRSGTNFTVMLWPVWM
jgi:hypothetical protein